MTYEELEKMNKDLDKLADKLYRQQTKNELKYIAEHEPFKVHRYQILNVRLRVTEETRKNLTDAGATNRKLGSDMGYAVTGGGLHGKDLSKADVSVNVVCYLLAEKHKQKVEAYCAIGDENILFQLDDGTEIDMAYDDVVLTAKDYIINQPGGFEKFAEYGLI